MTEGEDEPKAERWALVPTRRVRFEANPFEVLIAFLGMLAAIGALLTPDDLRASAVGQAIAFGWAIAWTVGYGLSGFLILGGLWKGSARVEAAGLIGFAASVGIQTVALFDTRGGPAVTSIAAFAAILAACAVRAHTILTGRRHVIVDLHRPPIRPPT